MLHTKHWYFSSGGNIFFALSYYISYTMTLQRPRIDARENPDSNPVIAASSVWCVYCIQDVLYKTCLRAALEILSNL